MLVAGYHLFCTLNDASWYTFWSATDLVAVQCLLLGTGCIFADIARTPSYFPHSHLHHHRFFFICMAISMGCTFVFRVLRHRESPAWALVISATTGAAFCTLCVLENAEDIPSMYYSYPSVIFGCVVFMTKMPERLLPNMRILDLVGNSHQIWHVCYLYAFYCWTWDIIQLHIQHELTALHMRVK
eukprot:GFYU01017510.1.p1 GENE.GFYU01017510.1~~GFYU01017510.1.p1  ORF type:complete len:210 (-),score=24.40 GFYU01017510.1:86-640(-)